MDRYPTYLIHYGVPGQKWGVRRWQYEDGSLTPEGYEHYGYGKKESTKQKINYLKSRDSIKIGKITKEVLSKLSGSKYLSDLDSMYVSYGYKFSNEITSGLGTIKLNDIKNTDSVETIVSGRDVGSHFVSPALALKKNQSLNLDDGLVMNSVVRRINPNYGERGTTNNCIRCSAALTLAKMGYSTPQGISAGRSLLGAESDGFSYWFNGAKKVEGNYSDISSKLSSQPKGSFGEFDISRYDANGNRIGGHSMAYSILNDGSVRIEDGQTGKMYSNIRDAMNSCSASDNGMSFTRLDNTTPNMKALSVDSIVDVGGNRRQNDTYMLRDNGNFNYDNNTNRVTSYNFKNSGTMVSYSKVGTNNTGMLDGREQSNIVFDKNGNMYYRGR